MKSVKYFNQFFKFLRCQFPETAARSLAGANFVAQKQNIFPVKGPLTRPEFSDVAMSRENLEELFPKINQVLQSLFFYPPIQNFKLILWVFWKHFALIQNPNLTQKEVKQYVMIKFLKNKIIYLRLLEPY